MTTYGRARTKQRGPLRKTDPSVNQVLANRAFDEMSRHQRSIWRFWDSKQDSYLRLLKTDLHMARNLALSYYRQGYRPDDPSLLNILEAFHETWQEHRRGTIA